jgi:hypothetical protein
MQAKRAQEGRTPEERRQAGKRLAGSVHSGKTQEGCSGGDEKRGKRSAGDEIVSNQGAGK